MYKVLITGFEAYWDYPENSSWVVAENLSLMRSDISIVLEQMPVSFARSGTVLRNVVKVHRPDLLLMLGQSGGSDRVKLERLAINLKDAKLPDNDGYIADEEAIDDGGENVLFTNVPIKQLRSLVQEAGIRVKISNSCGLYVCNRLYYEALKICRESPSFHALFIHLPFYEGQPSAKPGKPIMPLGDMTKAISIIIEELYDKSAKV
ncbi:pyroglutamyl-peptidase I [Porphyromonas levii]|uniref:pyroglutamyl-peptidase I family protein n=1 Tax=Porphyromonas levii TaxID=28114 RepID=UPI001B8D1F0F|nr:pyroglutamyl-peptidase I [Porphyromonas levii]MBR8713338.1 Pyrrolidone-carboxylate peptidase [Porphyromonas levii]MBR8715343.1 Pyrrolidone-carboxylate peptidase [Porphyromonas levii]MBR8727869.1 Pyrrolidone-carboxylate peptidase [Porphyromonas levii]MBR8730342.1 Pyrrolidone-carboxylate peptidase [Porphyromonas levii]MBR8736204.1 Pyrrolidone-carboxylate peptidase [Porphyromonas levii]